MKTMASFKAFGIMFASTSLCYLNQDRTQVWFVENMMPCWVLVMIKYITLCQRLSSLQFGRLWVSDILNIIIHTVIMIVKILLLFAINSGSIVSHTCRRFRKALSFPSIIRSISFLNLNVKLYSRLLANFINCYKCELRRSQINILN